MSNAEKYLDALKAHWGGVSDYRVAKNLDVSTSAVSRWRTVDDSFSPETAKKVADALETDAAVVVIEAEIDRAKTAEQRAIWEQILRRLTATAAVVCLAVAGLAAPSPAHAASGLSNDGGIRFVLCKAARRDRLARLLAALKALFVRPLMNSPARAL